MLSLIVREVIFETEDTKTFLLEEVNGRTVPYEAGQFLILILFLQGRELRRSYSISSTPGIDPMLAITVRKVVNGQVSRFLLNHIHVGSALNALPPAGRFTIDTQHQQRRDVILFAAGSGITPVFSLLKKILKNEPESNTILLTQNQNESSVIFRKQLTDLAMRSNENYRWLSFLSNPVESGSSVKRLQVEILTDLIYKQLKHPKENAIFYLCGPIPFMRMIEFTIMQLGFEQKQVRKEIFEVPVLPPVSDTHDTNPHQIKLIYQNKLHVVSAAYPATILDAALRNQIEVPYSCRAGVCSTCVAICKKGTVTMRINEVLTDEDLEKGLVLTCVGYAETDVEIEWPSQR